MAEIGDIQVDAEGKLGQPGQPYRLGASGWVPVSQQDVERLTSGPLQRFGAGFLGGATDTTAGALGRLTDIASIGLGLGSIAKQGAKAGISALAGTSSERVRQALTTELRNRELARRRQQLGGSLSTATERGSVAFSGDEHLLRQLGGESAEQNTQLAQNSLRSVGAAEVNTVRQGVFDLFTAPADLTDVQSKAIPVAERLGFKFLPGQIQGSKLFLEGIKSDPILRGAVEWELAHNRSALQQAAARALGLSDTVLFDADAMGLAATILGEGFEGIGDHIGRVTIGAGLADDIAPLLSSKFKRAIGYEQGAAFELEGRAVMNVRTRLMQQSSDAWRKGDSVIADDINEVIGALDELISPALSPGVKQQWRALKEKWRIFRVLEKPRVVDLDTGVINQITARNWLQKEFKGEFGRQAFTGTGTRRGNISAATSEFMDWIRVSNAFKDAVGDSGTATRLLSVQNLTHPKETGKKWLARKMIEFEADRLNVP